MKIMIEKGTPRCRQGISGSPGTICLILYAPRKNESEKIYLPHSPARCQCVASSFFQQGPVLFQAN